MSNFLPTTTEEKRKRLKSLQNWLKDHHYDGFFVPREDEFQGEEIPPYRERLAWLMGFDGSAGLGLVTKDKAVLFVDGRYTLQARLQVDTESVTTSSLDQDSLITWLRDNMAAGQIIAYDPWIHTSNQLKQFEEAANQNNIKLTAIDQNPIDHVWQDKPAASKADIAPQPLDFSGVAHHTKIANVQQELVKNGADGVWLGAPDSVSWLLNIRSHDLEHTPFVLAFAFVPRQGKVALFVDSQRATPQLKEWFKDVAEIIDPKKIKDFVTQSGQNKQRIQLDPATVPVWFEQNLTAAGALIIKTMDPCRLPKACKNPVEQEGTRQAHIRDGAALCNYMMWLNKNVGQKKITETEAADQLLKFRKKDNLLRCLGFSTISGMGSNGAIIHYRPIPGKDAELVPEGIYLVDSGGQYLDGTTDVTRSIAMGPVTSEQRENYTRVLKGHLVLGHIYFPEGTTGSQLDALARQFLWQVGLDYKHGTGHGVGSYLGVHEGPQRISPAPNTVALKPGMIVSNEPGFYKEGEYGIRIENLIMVKQSDKPGFLCFETLTLAPYDRDLIDTSLLTPQEIKWVNDYHQRVLTTLTPLVDGEVREWLKEATQKI